MEELIKKYVGSYLSEQFNWEGTANQISIQQTRKEFEGELTVVLFPFLKIAKMSPDQLGQYLGEYLVEELAFIDRFNVVKGFLNLRFSDHHWISFIGEALSDVDFGKGQDTGEKILVEFSSPNTNKPLHLGHIRNILLGASISNILEEAGHQVIRTQVINDRGIAICKSMLAWKKFGEGKTPASVGIKGDHFVGQFYVAFEQAFQKEYKVWQDSREAKELLQEQLKQNESETEFFSRFKNQYFNEYSELGGEAKQLLREWENGEPEAVSLWKQMNDWVYQGFDTTYAALDVHFDKNYYESDTYLIGKKYVEKGKEQGLFYSKEDGSVWVDLEERKLDHKILLRADGTSLYITQDIGTAQERYQDFGMNRMIYVVGDEQEYHFQVLFEILDLLQADYAKNCYHLAYGMVDLPSGKMKSREGTVVDADDLIADVIEEARLNAGERGELSGLPEDFQNDVYRMVGLAALKFFILRVGPKRRMVFDPKESVDLQGQTGPYIQNAYVRIQSIFRKLRQPKENPLSLNYELKDQERSLANELSRYADIVKEAAEQYDPSIIANYAYDLAKMYHKFYHDISINREEDIQVQEFRLQLSGLVSEVLKKSMALLGIEMPERM